MSLKHPSLASAKLPFWQGRLGEPEGERLFHVVRSFDELQASLSSSEKGFAFLGFCCDEGIRRNQGRIGAALAPLEIRKALGNTCLHQNVKDQMILDAGDVVCPLAGDLGTYQKLLADKVKSIVSKGLCSIVLGGGHETAFGHYLGLEEKYGHDLCVINIDAHFDLRSYKPGEESSGTPFTQIAARASSKNNPFDYLVLGIQKISNGRNLFETAERLGASYLEAREFFAHPERALEKVKAVVERRSFVYLSICLDAFSHGQAPGVSAPQAFGLLPYMILDVLDYLAQSKKMVAFDVVELSPPFDHDHQTAKLAASFVWHLLDQSSVS